MRMDTLLYLMGNFLTGLSVGLVAHDQNGRGVEGLLKVLGESVKVVIGLVQALVARPTVRRQEKKN